MIRRALFSLGLFLERIDPCLVTGSTSSSWLFTWVIDSEDRLASGRVHFMTVTVEKLSLFY